MANNTRTATTTTTTTRAAKAAAPTAPVAATAPHGASHTVVTGTPAAKVPHLAYLATLPVPVVLAAPTAPWAGWGKGVRVTVAGTPGTAYANRGNLDLRTTPAHAAALAKAVPGATVRGAGANYVRLPFTATGTPQA